MDDNALGNSNTKFNRCEKLKKNLERFDKQQMPKDVKISIAISNSASTDHTEQFLNKLEKRGQTFFYLMSKLIGPVEIMASRSYLTR